MNFIFVFIHICLVPVSSTRPRTPDCTDCICFCSFCIPRVWNWVCHIANAQLMLVECMGGRWIFICPDMGRACSTVCTFFPSVMLTARGRTTLPSPCQHSQSRPYMKVTIQSFVSQVQEMPSGLLLCWSPRLRARIKSLEPIAGETRRLYKPASSCVAISLLSTLSLHHFKTFPSLFL